MNAEDLLAAYEERRAAIVARLDAGDAADAVKNDIVGLFKETEAAIERLTAFKETIRELVQRYKSLAGEKPAPAPAPRGRTVVSDLIGSTTYIERGWSAIAGGDAKRAVKELERALELAPNDPQAETLLGWAQMLRGHYDDALFTYYKVLAKTPDNPLARVNLGYICLKKGIFGEAIEHLSKAIRQEQDRKASLYAHFYMGLVYAEREMFDDARAFFRKTLELGPNMLEAWWEMGRAFYLEGNHRAAAEAWRQGVETNRFSLWGERCGVALKQVDAGEPVTFATQNVEAEAGETAQA
ncbi:tetratricopeptide repeat protein [Longimicrobium sp.]|uniref:tetratricopeptide repeat protein n=1 Tax=Longimicrobium sp. TaxID=2029185 RepID=UPI002CDF58EB|nr:tetratricopeptide repeat protein [Longimicrobium sp.]HSU17908.1 tetratricopeptide repeat protein [Longimicrobium sp.]